MKSFSHKSLLFGILSLFLFSFFLPLFVSTKAATDPLASALSQTTTTSVQSTYEAARKKIESSTSEITRNTSSTAEIVRKGDENWKSSPVTLTPEEIAEIKIEAKKRAKDFLLTVSWQPSKNTLGTILKQLLYVSEDKGKSWNAPKELNAAVNSFSMTGKANQEYYFKITTVDRSGNESKGVIKTYKVPALVSTGSPLFLTLGIALLGGALWTLQRRKFL